MRTQNFAGFVVCPPGPEEATLARPVAPPPTGNGRSSLGELNQPARGHRRAAGAGCGRNRPNPGAGRYSERRHSEQVASPATREETARNHRGPEPVSAAVVRDPRMGRLRAACFAAWAAVGTRRSRSTIGWGCSGPAVSLFPGSARLQQEGGSLVASESSGCRRWTTWRLGGSNQQASEPTTTRPPARWNATHSLGQLALPASDCQRRPDFLHIVMS